MGWLVFVLHIFIGSTLAGAGVIALLSLGMDGVVALVGAAIAGYVIAIPVAFITARAILRG